MRQWNNNSSSLLLQLPMKMQGVDKSEKLRQSNSMESKIPAK